MFVTAKQANETERVCSDSSCRETLLWERSCCSTLISSTGFYHQCRRLVFSLLGQISFCSFSLFFESGLFICSLICCKKFVFYLMIKIQRTAFSLLAPINGVFDVLFCLMCSSVSYLNSTKLIKSNQMLTINYT